MILYHNIRKLYTPLGTEMKRGKAMRELLELTDAAILVDGSGQIEAVSATAAFSTSDAQRIDCRGLIALPGFVDSHTHAVFFGERSKEFTMRAEGRSYQEIAAMGGGIRSSVAQVRGASLDDIVQNSSRFVASALRLGTTTMEIKSGYGLSTESEIMLLRAAKLIGETSPMEIVTTYLGAHAVPSGVSQADYVNEIIQQQLPEVASARIAEFCDVFMDEGYFTKDETLKISRVAAALGFKIKLHADELAETGGAETAVELGAYSADHLLEVSDRGIEALAGSERTVATLLPITALSLRAPFAPARKLMAAGCAVAIATDCNPGSAMSENMQFALTLAVIGMQMSPEEALTAATLNGAAALGRADTHGSLERNKVADFVLYDMPALEYLPYHIAVSDVAAVIKRGNIVSGGL